MNENVMYSTSGFFYQLEGEDAIVVGTKEWPEVLVIPSELDGHRVIGIGISAFDTDKASEEYKFAPVPVTKDLFPLKLLDASISTHICNRIKEVVLPETIEFIGAGAFYQNNSLHKINFPKSLKRIDSIAFANADLDHILVPKECDLYHEEGDEPWQEQGAFEYCGGCDEDGNALEIEIEYY